MLDTQLANSNVVVSTGATGSPGPDLGNITISAPVTWSTNAALSLSAANTLHIDAPITIAGGGQLSLDYSTSSIENLNIYGGTVTFAPGFAGQALTINGASYTLLYSMADVQSAMNANLAGDFALAGDIASTSVFTSAVVAPTGGGSFTGTLEGFNHTISGLTINDTSGGGNDGLIGTSAARSRHLSGRRLHFRRRQRWRTGRRHHRNNLQRLLRGRDQWRKQRTG